LNKSLDLTILFNNEISNNLKSFLINVFILDDSPLDLIIGLKTIKQFNLFTELPSLISTNELTTSSTLRLAVQNPEPSVLGSEHVRTPLPLSVHENVLVSLLETADRFFGVQKEDLNEIPDKVGSFEPWLPTSFPVEDVLSKINISGTDELKSKIVSLCEEFRDLFCDVLPEQPAKVKPFDIIVNEEQWQVPSNRTPPRRMSPQKQDEVQKQIAELLRLGIIEKSNATYYSQVLLIPKPGVNQWRLCVDYRALNDCTADASWPIPNIDQMLRRIGNKNPKFFGSMDLTQGYHQAPVSLMTRVFTAFILFCGLYQFTRLPFGPKRAPSYFQEQMAGILVGLIYYICEMYLDDIIVFGQTENEFITNLRVVFIRLNKHNLKLKAQKCFFGFQELEWVGKIVSSEGLKMSRTRIQKLLDFPQPVFFKQLKSFLGVVNYFRDFIRNQSIVVKPLHNLLTNYKKHSKISWTPESVKAFTDTKESVRNVTTLYFMNDKDPITLCTDASDYGIGGYLYQTIDMKDYPIAFVSMSLSGPQTRWATIQKEAYAIFHCCMQLESLLRDRKFKILTDHKNLLYIKGASNPMIVRWYMALSEFDFSLGFIAGSDNIIADSMSRLCENNLLETPSQLAPEITISALVMEEFTLSDYHRSLIESTHNSIAGHSGVKNTVKRLVRSKLNWPYMRQHVKHFIRNCPVCQKLSASKFPTYAHPFTTSTYVPMECLNIDFIGPFPDNGYILVIIDTFTRWVELFRTPDATAISAARCLVRHFGRFGAPAQIRSDQGPHFTAAVVEQFLLLVGVQHCKTLPYSSQENSIVERCNKEINRHIRALTFDNNTLEDYEESLPFVQRILNSNHSSKLGISAAELLFGKMIDLDYGLFISPVEREAVAAVPLQDYMIKLLAMQDSLMEAAKKQLLCLDTLHVSNKLNEQYEFAIDSYVLVRYRKSAPPSRLHTSWRGPLRVLSYRNTQYTLLDLITKKEKVYHVSDMKPFLFDPAITDPQDVARHDYLEFFVENILEHRGNLKLKSTIEFHIKWLGYPEVKNSWEPYSNLRDLDILHDYLKQHKLSQLIPKKFR
jgi:transposase InsO family protein